MKWCINCIILISTFAVIHSRPQDTTPQNEEPTVEVEKQTIVEVTPNLKKYNDQFPQPTQRKIEDKTKEILEKIAEVNRKHGLKPRKERPNFFHFPFSYSRSQEEQGRERSFSSSPFSNPILEYLIRNKNDDDEAKIKTHSPHLPSEDDYENYDDDDDDDEPVYEKSLPNKSDMASITKDDIIPGHYIKRKIVHQQTFAIPMPSMQPSHPNFMMPQNMPANFMAPQNIPQGGIPFGINLPQHPVPSNNEKHDNTKSSGEKVLSNLEKQTINNVKNIVSSTQMSQGLPMYYNPYLQYNQNNFDQYQYNPFMMPYTAEPERASSNDYSYRIYGPYKVPSTDRARQNWNWPGANYFPIYIRDPFLQFYNAITSMIEYGPTAGQGGPCKRPPKIKGKDETTAREAKLVDQEKEQIVVEMSDKSTGQIAIYSTDSEEKNTDNYVDIENIDIGGNKDGGIKLTLSIASSERKAKDSENRVPSKANTITNPTRFSSKLEKFPENKDIRAPPFFKPQMKPLNATATRQPTQSPPIRDPTIQIEDLDDDAVDQEKSEEITISNDGNKKIFSRDNTGSGIFIHKLKVRKGGVAIAGPGGIATAGSGGTAIVGPNGVAYTQPDSLAIAGSGTKVVAVDPKINLGDLINSTSLTNRTAFPPSRVGRVVAVGPVIYYNKG